ncbi:hypothetical protein U4Y98_20620, partial [Escherichia coli]|nr:hypothetical protein [Escherichia coli]
MSKKYQPLLITHYMSTWVTITEAVEITTKAIKQKITPSDIYRHALSGNILLSVYFGNDSNLLIVFYVQIMPDDLVMQLHR